jgi:arachidonate 15-lipoxygenase
MRLAYTDRHRALMRAPEMPAEFDGPDAMDLGVLAVASPYACYLERDGNGTLHWDFRDLENHDVHDGLYSLGCRVIFDLKNRKLTATAIECELGRITPKDEEWLLAKQIALASASNQISLVQHFNHVHLACGGPLAIATRNELDHDHPLCRLIWPHVYGTQNSNYLVTRLQLVKGGAFETMFSFTHRGLWKLYTDTYNDYRASAIVPVLDWQDRGLEGLDIESPAQDNLVELYDVMHAHALRYVMAYYDSDDALASDAQVVAWVKTLNSTIPNGVERVLGGRLTRAGIARLIGGAIHMASVQHEALGAYLWDYQLWLDRNPVQVRKDGQRMPLDVLQKVLNGNFNLNVNRAVLMQDFSYMAVDDKGIALFWQFEQELRMLELKLKAKPHATWRVLPSRLDANINA